MNRRPRRGWPASLCALVLLAACVLVAIDAIQIAARRRPLISYARFAAELHRLHWNGTVCVVAAGVLIGLGVILLLTALVPGRLVLMALSSGGSGDGGSGPPDPGNGVRAAVDPWPDAGITRRGLRNMLTAAAGSVDGVTSVSLRLRRRSVAAVAHTLGSTEGLADAVRAALAKCLGQTSPARQPELRVRAATRGDS